MKVVREILSDGTDNCLSSKRVITMFAFALCSLAFVTDLFWDKKVEPFIFEGMMYIAIAGLGFTASEKFASHRSPNSTNRIPQSELRGRNRWDR